MTATKTTAPTTILSGHCGIARHGACAGSYGGYPCRCDCHDEPAEPEPSGPRILSLFSGYGGLDLAVRAVLGGEVIAHAEIEPAACRILEHRFPGIPNLGDVSTVDWATVGPVDVLCGGFPCQDVSAAGKRAGIAPGTRSGLWAEMARAIQALRPPLVLIENVRGLTSADAHHPAHGDLEPCTWCLGDDGPVLLRALGAVLGDLADLGFDAEWVGLRAADVGAPHGRFRVFVAAWPADTKGDTGRLGDRNGRSVADAADHDGDRSAAAGTAGRRPGGSAAHPDRLGHERDRRARDGWPGPADGAVAAAYECGFCDGDHYSFQCPGTKRRPTTPHPEGDGRHKGRPEPARLIGGPDAALSGADAAADADEGGRGADLGELRAGQPDVTWGAYGPAIARWERCLGRPAPAPTERGKNGQPRLSPAFVEWLMGLPAGWVTDVPGLTRNEQLKALGNGVVPQQAATALRILLGRVAALDLAA